MRIRYADRALADLDAIHEYQAVHWRAALLQLHMQTRMNRHEVRRLRLG